MDMNIHRKDFIVLLYHYLPYIIFTIFIVVCIIIFCCLAIILCKSCTDRLSGPENQNHQNQEEMEMERFQGDDNPDDI